MLYGRDTGGDNPYNPGGSNVPVAEPTPTASAPAPTPPPQNPTISVGGYTPDYGGLISNDPAYLAAKSATEQAQANAAAQRKQQLRQALIQYGGLPSGFTDQYGDLDQATLDAASQNQNSTLAQLAKNYSQSGEQFRRSLAARGALQSGDLNYGQDQLDQGYAQQRYDAANQFGNSANSVLGQYMGVLSGNAQSLAGAIGQAEGNVSSQYQPVAAQTATYDSSASGQYGQPIYTGPDGKQYDQYGNPFTPPTAAPAASPAADPYASADYWGNAHRPGVQM
jgi:hypothetical protein